VIGALERLGGVLLHPRATLKGVLEGRGGSFFELLPLLLVVPAIVAPVSAGQALLVGRVAVVDGLRAYLGLVANRVGGPVMAAVIGALVLVLVDRVRPGTKRDLSFDRTLDACLFALVPFFLFAVLGKLLSSLGWELWFLPHRPTRGRGLYLLARLAAGYLWPALLFLGMLWAVWRGQLDGADAPEEASDER
jgi:hypothetical protein